MLHRPYLAAFLLLLCLAPPGRADDEATPGPRVGEVHPDLRLPTLSGDRTISLRDLRGHKVLLIEFASW